MSDTRKPTENGGGQEDGANGRFPWMEPVNEDLALEADGGTSSVLIGAAVVVVLLFASFMYYIYMQGQGSDNMNEIPLIASDKSPVKIEPEERGGANVPHQERLVFDRITGETTPVEDNVRSAPEQPMELDVMPAPVDEAGDADVRSEAAPAQQAIEPAKSDEIFAPKGRYLVQIGAFASLDAADKFWSGLRSKYPAILKGLSDEVQRAEVATRVLYRLRIGYMLTRGEADRVCSDLKSRGQDCMVINP